MSKKKKITFQQFNKMINQFLTELGMKRRRQLEEYHQIELLTEYKNKR